MTEQKKPPTLTDAEVQNELVNDSLGTVDPADTTYTDPKNDSAAKADPARKDDLAAENKPSAPEQSVD